MPIKNNDKKKAYDKAYLKVWRLAHKKQIKAYQVEYDKRYRIANKDKIKARQKISCLAHKGEKKIYDRHYRFIHKEEKARKSKIYRQENPEKARNRSRKRRALKYGVGHRSYKDSYIFERDGWVCQICGRKINKRLKWPNPLSKSIDHIIPLSKGGNDAPINVQATHLRCNVGKHAINNGQLKLFG